eukprot:5740050-Pleurochrysis_carterae.AAC.1
MVSRAQSIGCQQILQPARRTGGTCQRQLSPCCAFGTRYPDSGQQLSEEESEESVCCTDTPKTPCKALRPVFYVQRSSRRRARVRARARADPARRRPQRRRGVAASWRGMASMARRAFGIGEREAEHASK